MLNRLIKRQRKKKQDSNYHKSIYVNIEEIIQKKIVNLKLQHYF